MQNRCHAGKKTVVGFGDVFFRSNLQGARQLFIPLSKELEHVQAYLALEQARFPGRYRLNIQVEPGLEETLIPPFTLQPLVENSISHGFAGRRKGGMVNIQVYNDQGHVVIEVKDNGKGMDKERLNLLGKKKRLILIKAQALHYIISMNACMGSTEPMFL